MKALGTLLRRKPFAVVGIGSKEMDPLAALAGAIAGLTPADRQRLAAMLTGHRDGGEGKADAGPGKRGRSFGVTQ
jgi:hypothetical protein